MNVYDALSIYVIDTDIPYVKRKVVIDFLARTTTNDPVQIRAELDKTIAALTELSNSVTTVSSSSASYQLSILSQFTKYNNTTRKSE